MPIIGDDHFVYITFFAFMYIYGKIAHWGVLVQNPA